MFVSFVCHQESVSHLYSSLSLQTAMRPCAVARETYLRINDQGILCIQHQVEATQGGILTNGAAGGNLTAQDIFIDYLIVPNYQEEAITHLTHQFENTM